MFYYVAQKLPKFLQKSNFIVKFLLLYNINEYQIQSLNLKPVIINQLVLTNSVLIASEEN